MTDEDKKKSKPKIQFRDPTIPRNKRGNRGKINEEVVGLLYQAFAFGCSDAEACIFAGISKASFYEYQKKHPEVKERKELLKETPVLEARKKTLEGIKQDYNLAFSFLKSKRSDEFAEKQKTEMSGSLSIQQALDLLDEPSYDEQQE